MRIVRFVIITLAAAAAITIVGRVLSDPHDVIRGIGIWIVAVLLAILDALLVGRKSR